MKFKRRWCVVLSMVVFWMLAGGVVFADNGGVPDSVDADYLDEEAEVLSIADPLAPWNRAMFTFNDRLYFWVLKPVGRGYAAVVPEMIRVGIDNFFQNLLMPPRFASCLLQGKGAAAEAELGRFLVNTTIGVLGFMTPVKDLPAFNPPKEDLGQTLGAYGIGNGIYLVWPFFGPSTLRDSVGMVGDRFLSPLTYLEPAEAVMGATALKTVNDTSLRIGDYEAFLDSAIIPYDAMRDAYLQHREKKVSE